MGPARTPTAAPAPTTAPPPATLNPRTVVYTVAGTKQLLDLVNVVYTDARGYPQTEFNVSLPWSKAIVLNPGVQTEGETIQETMENFIDGFELFFRDGLEGEIAKQSLDADRFEIEFALAQR